MRVSRPCYDKMHRCPGWAGGGMRNAKRDRCDGGSLAQVIDYDGSWWRWRMHVCPTCGVRVLPYMVRYADWRWYHGRINFRVRLWWRYDRPRWLGGTR